LVAKPDHRGRNADDQQRQCRQRNAKLRTMRSHPWPRAVPRRYRLLNAIELAQCGFDRRVAARRTWRGQVGQPNLVLLHRHLAHSVHRN
jgi:hypothetical protein